MAVGKGLGSEAMLMTRSAFLLSIIFLAGCASSNPTLGTRVATADGVGLTLPAGDFLLEAVERSGTGKEAFIFIEGDGRPWLAGGRVIAADPTPMKTPMLDAMLQAPAPALYLTRPCYFKQAAACHPMLWTYSRYSERVLSAMHSALESWLKTHPEVERVTLIGHSGGGVLAILLGERIPQVHRIIALAAPLDIDRWADLHGYGRLFDSINPASQDHWREDVSRYLLFGRNDKQVPPELFLTVANGIPNAHVRVVENAGHDCCEAFAYGLIGLGKGNDPTSIDCGLSVLLERRSGTCPDIAR
jgi:predicted alpha/beta hydrolase family esterase